MNEKSAVYLLSVVVPCFNEETTLSDVLADFVATLDDGGLKDRYELIVVDDGSTDRCGTILRDVAARTPQIVGIHREINGGMWRAIHTGLEHVRGRYVTYLPADGEIGARQVLTLMEHAEDHDMVLSDRAPIDAQTEQEVRPWFRSVLTWGHRLFIKSFLGFDIRGSEGIMLLRWSVFRGWATAPRTDNVLFLEILARAFRNKVRIAKTTTYYERRRGGRSKIIKPSYILDTVVAIVRLGVRIRGSSDNVG